jgi:hypothetical protein
MYRARTGQVQDKGKYKTGGQGKVGQVQDKEK